MMRKFIKSSSWKSLIGFQKNLSILWSISTRGSKSLGLKEGRKVRIFKAMKAQFWEL
jgi:hypothetical protein